MKRIFVTLSVLMLAVSACGILGKNNAGKPVSVPTSAQADSIVNIPGAASFVMEKDGIPVIYALVPHRDSATVAVVTMSPVKGVWMRTSSVSYPFADDIILPLASAADSSELREFGGRKYLTARCLRTDGTTYQKSVITYCPEEYSLEAVSFTGKKRRDGRVYGSSNLRMLANPGREHLVWAESVLKREKDFVFLSEAQIQSDQAIEWWLSKNAGGPARIAFGQLPEGCTLVQTYLRKKRESGGGYYAALFDTDEYTVIVAKNRSAGTYFLAWVEPRCRNSRTDALLNNIYFSSGSRLTMFYYKGSRTYKRSLSLANGEMK